MAIFIDSLLMDNMLIRNDWLLNILKAVKRMVDTLDIMKTILDTLKTILDITLPVTSISFTIIYYFIFLIFRF